MEKLTAIQAEVALDSPDRRIDENVQLALETEGWRLAGQEYPLSYPLNEQTGRFEPVRVLSEEEIAEKYLETHGQHGFDEVRIEVSHHYDTGWPDESRVFVYLRRPEDVYTAD